MKIHFCYKKILIKTVIFLWHSFLSHRLAKIGQEIESGWPWMQEIVVPLENHNIEYIFIEQFLLFWKIEKKWELPTLQEINPIPSWPCEWKTVEKFFVRFFENGYKKVLL